METLLRKNSKMERGGRERGGRGGRGRGNTADASKPRLKTPTHLDWLLAQYCTDTFRNRLEEVMKNKQNLKRMIYLCGVTTSDDELVCIPSISIV